MTKRVLVTGHQGFIGSVLSQRLEKGGHTVLRPEFEITDYKSVERALTSAPWDVMIHLAGMSHVVDCDRDPAKAFQINLAGSALMVEAMERNGLQGDVVFASTAQVYAGPRGEEIVKGVTFDESREIFPQNTYARTKRAAELVLEDFSRRRALRGSSASTIVLRLFNHTHKTQAREFFLPHIYKLMEPHRGTGHAVQIPVGNLHVCRDIGALSDVVEAFSAVVNHDGRLSPYSVFNICSGEAKNLGDMAQALAGRLDVRAEFVREESRVRAGEPVSIRGSYSLFEKTFGWRPLRAPTGLFLESFLGD